MSYFAAAAVRGPDGWSASEVDLAGVADVDEVAERLRDVDPDAELSLLFVEADDMYLAVLRLDDGEDLRVFGSDSAFAAENRLGALLLSDAGPPAVEIEVVEIEVVEPIAPAAPAADEEPEQPVAAPDANPVGDADILADLGLPAHRLLELCGHDGLLPADVTAELSQALGFGDEIEELREA